MRLGVLIAALLLGLPATASAQAIDAGTADPEGETGQTDDGFFVTAGHVGDRRLTDSPGPRPGRVVRCEFWEVFGTSVGDANPFPVAPSEGQLYELRCFVDGVMLPEYPTFIIFDPPVIADPAVSTDEITTYAYRSMTFDAPEPAINPVADQVVGIPTWLAVSSRLDYPSVSAAAGPVWASVRPELRDVVFTMPNGDTVRCDRESDMTLVWDAANGDAQSSDCTYTFTSNGESPDGEPVEAEIVATVTWDLYRETNLRPAEHWWSTHTETTVIPVTVRELQAVIN